MLDIQTLTVKTRETNIFRPITANNIQGLLDRFYELWSAGEYYLGVFIFIVMANNNSNLHAAKGLKDDEFYTTYECIAEELSHYYKHFKGKTGAHNFSRE